MACFNFRTRNSYVFQALYLISTLHLSQASSSSCVLDINSTSSPTGQICEPSDWGGFVNDCACEPVFEAYLYALSLRSNRTKKIFLNSSEQQDCSFQVKSCGFQDKLVAGNGGCSDFSTDEVFSERHDALKLLNDGCESGAKSCGRCVKSWSEIVLLERNETEYERDERAVCGLSVLVTLIGSRVSEKNWAQEVYKCLASQDSTKEKETKSGNDGERLRTELSILGGGVAAIAILGIFLKWRMYREKAKEASSLEKQQRMAIVKTSCKIRVKEVYLATNNLDPSNFIGQGIAGKVYKGKLSNEQHVAVKHMIKDGYFDTFIREVRSLSHVRHPNLITLIGFCETVDECFLVYELCRNGNLSEWLFGKEKVLFWKQRLRIAIDSAEALRFLHTYPQGCIVHRDIKPTNILLDDKFRAKLSDFGLSKVMELDQSHVISEVRGTFGYVDPEYRADHRVNPSGDVYSFGIVLLQLLSGQRLINLNSSNSKPLTKMAKSVMLGGDIEEFADLKLERDYSSEAFVIVLKLALECAGFKHQRPSMDEVVGRLENALEISIRFS